MKEPWPSDMKGIGLFSYGIGLFSYRIGLFSYGIGLFSARFISLGVI